MRKSGGAEQNRTPGETGQDLAASANYRALLTTSHSCLAKYRLVHQKPAGRPHKSDQTQKSQSSSSVLSALPMTYEDPDPEKKSWFSSALGDSADRIAGFTSVVSLGNIGS
jgi:hypothetical protein